MTILLAFLMFVVVLKVAGFFLRVFGRLIGFAFGFVGVCIIATLLITVCGFALFAGPVFIIMGIIALIVMIVRAAGKNM